MTSETAGTGETAGDPGTPGTGVGPRTASPDSTRPAGPHSLPKENAPNDALRRCFSLARAGGWRLTMRLLLKLVAALSQEGRLDRSQLREIRFSKTRMRPGYVMPDVDAFLDEVAQATW